MSRYTSLYCLIGIDKELNTAGDSPLNIQYTVVDYNNPIPFDQYEWHHGRISDTGWIERLLSRPEFKHVERFRVFPGAMITQREICNYLAQSGLTLRSYSEKTHSKDRLLDGMGSDIWRVSATSLYDFTCCKSTGQYTFDKAIEKTIQELDLKTVCIKYASAQKLVKNAIKDMFPEDNYQINTRELQMEVECNFNKGPNYEASHEGELLPVVGFDVNAMYTSCLLTENYSYTRMHLLDKHMWDVRSHEDWSFYIEDMKKYIPGDYEIRFIFRVDKAVAKDRDKLIRLSPVSKKWDKLYGGVKTDPINKKTLAVNTATIGLLFSDFCHFVEDYDWEEIELVHAGVTALRPLAVRLREYMLKEYSEENELKKQGKILERATKKMVRNNMPGYFQSLNMVYDEDDKACYAKIQSCRDYDYHSKNGKLRHHKSNGYFRQPLVGAELTQKARDLHRYICNRFRSRGLEVVYGNTDSIYVLTDTPEKRELALSIQKEYNHQNKEFMRSHLGQLENWNESISEVSLFGAIKVEFEGLILHNGINRAVFSEDGVHITKTSISEDMCGEDLKKQCPNIRDLHIGDSFMLPRRSSVDTNWVF